MEKIKELWDDYTDWTVGLGGVSGVVAAILPLTIIFVFVILFFSMALNRQSKNECLDSLLPRRYYNFVCEERINDEWIEVDSSDGKIYYYNEPASR